MKKPTQKSPSRPRPRDSKRFSIENIRVAHSPLSNELVIYRHGVDRGLALDKRYATPEIMKALMDYFFHDVEDSIAGIEQGFEINGNTYQVTVIRSRPKPKPTAALALLEVIADFDQTEEEALQELKEDNVDVKAFLDLTRPLTTIPNPHQYRLAVVRSPSPLAPPAPICRCAGPAYDPDSPCEVPGHTKLGPHGKQP